MSSAQTISANVVSIQSQLSSDNRFLIGKRNRTFRANGTEI